VACLAVGCVEMFNVGGVKTQSSSALIENVRKDMKSCA